MEHLHLHLRHWLTQACCCCETPWPSLCSRSRCRRRRRALRRHRTPLTSTWCLCCCLSVSVSLLGGVFLSVEWGVQVPYTHHHSLYIYTLHYTTLPYKHPQPPENGMRNDTKTGFTQMHCIVLCYCAGVYSADTTQWPAAHTIGAGPP